MISVVSGPSQISIGGKRYYQVKLSDGSIRNLRSVTTIGKDVKLASYLDIWEAEMIEKLGIAGFKRHMDILAARGTQVHSLIERFVRGETIIQTFDIADEDWIKFESYKRWHEKNKPEYVWQERALYSIKNLYAGRADAKILLAGKTYIIDYKTSKAVQDTHRCQGTAYLKADVEMGGGADGVIVLALGAENKQGYSESYVEGDDIEYYFEGFMLKNKLLQWQSPLPT